jgi:homoserine O-acetyltransferase
MTAPTAPTAPASTLAARLRALTYFDLARQHSRGSLTRALEGVSARTLLITFSSDGLHPPTREIEAGLRRLGSP